MAQTQHICGLKRLGENVKKYKLITLSGRDEVTIGRSPDVTVCLLSNVISRCHSVLKKDCSGNWTISDNKSLNGVFINGKKLKAQKQYELHDGDIVQLGVPTTPNQPAEFIYQFCEKMKIKHVRPLSTEEAGRSGQNSSSNVSGKYPMKRIKLDHSDRKNTQNTSSDTDCQVTSSQPELGCSEDEADGRQRDPTKGKEWSPFQEYKQKLKDQEEEASRKLEKYEAKLAEMQKMLQAKDAQNKEMELVLKQKEEEIAEELKKKQEQEERMREELENQLLDREARMLEQLQSQKDALIVEKQEVEQNLKQAMNRALEEKDRHLEAELTQQKERLENVINQKETKQRMLESQLNETKVEKDQQKEAMLHAREDILSNFAELMETELQCVICNELFIQATSLGCSHSFCAMCIEEWMKVKAECPMCRAAITSKMRSVVLDSYIDKMVEHLSDEVKQRRQNLVETRKAQKKNEEAAKEKEAAASTSGRGRRGRGRGRGRGRARGRGRGRSPSPVPVEIEPENHSERTPIMIESSDDDTSEEDFFSDLPDSDEESDEDYVRGESGAYFGGYGRCFRCGSRGHWANGCPYG